MMNNIYISILAIVLFVNTAICQVKNRSFEMVHLTGSQKSELYSFIFKERKDSIRAGMYIYHLLGEDKENGFRLVEGIYRFRLMGPHFPVYYFIYTRKKGIEIINNYTVENVIRKTFDYFDDNSAEIGEDKKLKYLFIIISDLKQR